MAKSDTIWTIDVGQCSLKALCCRVHDNPTRLVAEAFDFIEYPKILSQPDADPDELIREALQTLLSRNQIRGHRVAISISGQNGLARFIKLPPVESKKIPDIVRYEAKQQIPFDLQDVVWDYQKMGGGSEEEGFALETEVGLFAIKRDLVFRALEPFLEAGVEIDYVQLAPLALYNYLIFDQLTDLPTPEDYDPDDPPPSTVMLSLGTDATDLVVTNGFRVWQRSIPIGGNHFTKALTKELKLTFAKAEHLKRNAGAAEDPKAVFQAMRSVFSDLLTEVQRSIGYFTTLDRNARIDKIVALGNTIKLPGLRKYLTQSLGYDVVSLDAFRQLAGPEVINAPAFKENLQAFGVCYGLAVQGLNKGMLRTNLLPQEIVKDRLIREKKPWAAAAAAILLLAGTVSFASFSLAMNSVDEKQFSSAEQKAGRVASTAAQFQADATDANTQYDATDKIGQDLVENVEGRIRWLELLRVINGCLPKDREGKQPDNIMKRNQLQITNLECQRMVRTEDWFALMKQNKWYQSDPTEKPPSDSAPDPMSDGEEGDAPTEGPQGPGWLVQLTGHHYHNPKTAGTGLGGAQYVRNTLIANLKKAKILLPIGDGEGQEMVAVEGLGVTYPVLVNPGRVTEEEIEDPNASPDFAMENEGGGTPRGAKRTADDSGKTILRRFDFVVQFCWKPTPPTKRHEIKAEKAKQEAEAKAFNGR